MGFRAHYDGFCYQCGAATDIYCDACGKFICDTHQKSHEVRRSPKHFVFCQKCYAKGAKPTDPKRVQADSITKHYH